MLNRLPLILLVRVEIAHPSMNEITQSLRSFVLGWCLAISSKRLVDGFPQAFCSALASRIVLFLANHLSAPIGSGWDRTLVLPRFELFNLRMERIRSSSGWSRAPGKGKSRKHCAASAGLDRFCRVFPGHAVDLRADTLFGIEFTEIPEFGLGGSKPDRLPPFVRFEIHPGKISAIED